MRFRRRVAQNSGPRCTPRNAMGGVTPKGRATTADGRADRNLLLRELLLEVVDAPSAGLHCVSRCSSLLGIATAVISLLPQVVSTEKSVGIQGT